MFASRCAPVGYIILRIVNDSGKVSLEKKIIGLSIGFIKFEICRLSILGHCRLWCKLLCDLGGFPKITPRRKMFSELSMVDIQWENKGYSVSQIVQNNILPITLEPRTMEL